jgi:hypothetical protein
MYRTSLAIESRFQVYDVKPSISTMKTWLYSQDDVLSGSMYCTHHHIITYTNKYREGLKVQYQIYYLMATLIFK